MNDNVSHPYHYTRGKIEVIDFIEDQGLSYHVGNIVKYLCRARHKNNELEDLKKAQWYLTRIIGILESNSEMCKMSPRRRSYHELPKAERRWKNISGNISPKQ